jgi:hypothetical protein
MGADIYLKSVFDENNAKYRPLFEQAARNRDKYMAEHNIPSFECADETCKKMQNRVEFLYNKMMGKGYFRDSYSMSGISTLLHFSWWQTEYTEDGTLSIENAKKLLEHLKSVRVPMPKNLAESGYGKVEGELGYNEETLRWRAFFMKQRLKLIALLKTSIETNEPLVCSV